MHNLYPLLYNRTVAEATEAATGEWIIWARSTWAGSQRYPLHWGGDSSANWHNLAPRSRVAVARTLGLPVLEHGHRRLLRNGERRPAGALDAGGRALLAPAHHGTGDRELWKRPPETLARCREAIRLHYRLLPYLWAAAIDCVETALPVSRALVLEFPDDPTTRGVADQWLVGDALLAAPILDEGGRRKVYLPKGGWTDWASGERQEGRAGSTSRATSTGSRCGSVTARSCRWRRSWTSSINTHSTR